MQSVLKVNSDLKQSVLQKRKSIVEIKQKAVQDQKLRVHHMKQEREWAKAAGKISSRQIVEARRQERRAEKEHNEQVI